MKKFALTVAALAVATSFSSAAFAGEGAIFVGNKGVDNVVTKIKHNTVINQFKFFLENQKSGKVRKFVVRYNDNTGDITRNTGKNARMKTFLAEQVEDIIADEVDALAEDRRVRRLGAGTTTVVNKHGEFQTLSTADRSSLLSRAQEVMGITRSSR